MTSPNACASWPIAPGGAGTFYILAAIREHLDDLEDVYLAEQRLVDLRLGKSHAVPLEDVMARDGVDNRS